MDRHTLALLIPIITVSVAGLIGLSFTRLGKALANRIEGKVSHGVDEGRLDRLEAELEQTQQALAEMHERLDFAERMLARETRPPRLPSN